MVLLGDWHAESGNSVDLLTEKHRKRDDAGKVELRSLATLLDLLGLFRGEHRDEYSQRLGVKVTEGVTTHGRQEGRLRDAILFHADDEQLNNLYVGPLVVHKLEHDIIKLLAPLRSLSHEQGSHESEERDDSFVFVAHLQRADQRGEHLAWAPVAQGVQSAAVIE